MKEGTEGHVLHGSSGPEFDPYQYYVHRNGHMHAGLTVVAFQFAAQGSGDGGFALIPGSHKCNVSQARAGCKSCCPQPASSRSGATNEVETLAVTGDRAS
jgi:hypothetical protein